MANFEKPNDFYGNEKNLEVTENGTYTAPDGEVYKSVTVAVPPLTSESLEATENKTYTAPEGKAWTSVLHISHILFSVYQLYGLGFACGRGRKKIRGI